MSLISSRPMGVSLIFCGSTGWGESVVLQLVIVLCLTLAAAVLSNLFRSAMTSRFPVSENCVKEKSHRCRHLKQHYSDGSVTTRCPVVTDAAAGTCGSITAMAVL